uniref:Retinol dehydrogenase 13 n=1 Tax=Clastoptera arizonana TaxID=38151 RepID=A0A1B6DCI5_9HEMI
MGSNIAKPIVIASFIGTAFASSLIIKDYFGGKKYEGCNTAENKVIIITGANTGIGLETAKELAKKNAKVIMACRDVVKCEKARQDIVVDSKNKYVYCRKLDLSSLESIRNFSERFHDENNRLDILINNAGVMRCPYTKTKEGFELQLGVNHLGHFYLTNLLLDLLKKSAPSRIINVSSIAHTRGKINKDDLNSEKNYDPGDAYAQSKLANILFTKELASKLKDTGVTVNAVHPGIVDTEITRHMGFAKSYVATLLLKPIIWMFIKTPLQGAQTSLYAALSPDLDKVSGKYYR